MMIVSRPDCLSSSRWLFLCIYGSWSCWINCVGTRAWTRAVAVVLFHDEMARSMECDVPSPWNPVSHAQSDDSMMAKQKTKRGRKRDEGAWRARCDDEIFHSMTRRRDPWSVMSRHGFPCRMLSRTIAWLQSRRRRTAKIDSGWWSVWMMHDCKAEGGARRKSTAADGPCEWWHEEAIVDHPEEHWMKSGS